MPAGCQALCRTPPAQPSRLWTGEHCLGVAREEGGCWRVAACLDTAKRAGLQRASPDWSPRGDRRFCLAADSVRRSANVYRVSLYISFCFPVIPRIDSPYCYHLSLSYFKSQTLLSRLFTILSSHGKSFFRSCQIYREYKF